LEIKFFLPILNIGFQIWTSNGNIVMFSEARVFATLSDGPDGLASVPRWKTCRKEIFGNCVLRGRLLLRMGSSLLVPSGEHYDQPRAVFLLNDTLVLGAVFLFVRALASSPRDFPQRPFKRRQSPPLQHITPQIFSNFATNWIEML